MDHCLKHIHAKINIVIADDMNVILQVIHCLNHRVDRFLLEEFRMIALNDITRIDQKGIFRMILFLEADG